MRIVSLVPSVTGTLAALGAGDRLVGVTDYCTHGAPHGATRVGGTKNPSLDAVVALAPDVVVANAEENREADLAALRAAGLDVRVTYP
nr:ABC transporter substrate-binding protein [Euzebyales bacterium]